MARGDLLPEAVLRFEHRAINTNLELKGQLCVSVCIGREAFLIDQLAQLPPVRIGEIGILRRRVGMIITDFAQVRPMHFVRLLQAINLHAALGHLRFAIESRCGDTRFDRLVLSLPVAGAQCRL